ncbi:hypothetical protein FRC98_06025 [Lujinxingia vulgaris]|uniref:SbsA Ig-like domain-containing protein n=1 Tax=Lujinxingia vulgaris TaxID=2600176 RepID=A0A5C6XLF3_9DELT|nr:Ig-like domain-containing protein [Lujinxingia vulgaris]TXD38437.1 hypothetical protein FRC98_06025 [Lujinxingia vulgaris]
MPPTADIILRGTTSAKTTRRAIFLCLLCGLTAGCGPIDPPPPTDAEGEPIPQPAPLDDWLRVVEVAPAQTIATRPTIEVRFNAYLDPATFNSYSALSVRSGGLSTSGRIDYRMTRKTLRLRPRTDLIDGLRYTLFASPNLRSVTGAPLFPNTPAPERFTDATLPASPPLDRPPVTWSDIAPLFEHSCNGCHNDPTWQLPELTPETLRQTRSTQVDAPLLMPFEPASSYLMHKILPDYPRRRFTVQPPPYSDAPPLSLDEIERIEDWIAQGAR